MFNQRRIRILFSLFLYSCCFSYVFASAPEPPEKITQGDFQQANVYLNQLANYWLGEDELAGFSIAVVSDNKTTWEKHFGYSNVDIEKPINAESVYRVGAISGVFTATLILRLAELGKLNLEDDIAAYLPNIAFKYHDRKKYKITIHNLLTHHAGLPISRFEGSWLEKEPDLSELIFQLNQTYASYPPNTIYAYSNIGYSLLAMIVERVTKLSFSDALEQFVTKPLGMRNTTVRFSSSIKSQLTTGYKNGEPQRLLFPRDIGSLGIYSTASDMTKILMMLLEQVDTPVLSQSSIKSMMSPQNAHVELDLEKRIGLGLNIGGMDVTNGGDVVWRNGTTLSYRSRIALLPKYDLAVVVLSNDNRSWDALEDISERALQVMLKVKMGIDQSSEDKLESKKYTQEKFENFYASFLGYIPVQKNVDGISANLLGWPLLVVPDSDGWYTLQYDLFGFIPIDVSWIADVKVRSAVVGDKKILIALYKGKQYLIGYHFPVMEIDRVWVKRLGNYKIINHDALLENMEINQGTLTIIDNKLIFVYELPNWYGFELQVPIQTVSANLAIIPGLGTALNETIQVKQFGNKEYLEYSGYLLQKVVQDKGLFDFF